MTILWAITICANVILLGMMLFLRSWRRFPLFFGQQAICIALTMLLVWGWYSLSVSTSDYHAAWVTSDQMCIIGETLAAWEIMEKCWMRWLSCLLATLLFIHALISLTEYSYFEDAMFNHHISMFRQILNLAITFALPCVLYAERKEICNDMR